MQLKKIEIKNYRSIKSLELTFERNFQVLVGLNEAGKSNILNALSLLDKQFGVTKNDIRDPRHDEEVVEESYVRFVFKLSKSFLERVFEGVTEYILSKKLAIPIIDIGGKSYSLEEFCKYKNEVLYVVDVLKGSRTFSHWGLAGPQYRVHPEWKKVSSGHSFAFEHNGENLNIADFKIVNTLEFKMIPSNVLEDLDMSFLNLMVGAKMIELTKDKLPPCIVWNYTEKNLLPERISLPQFITNPNICIPLKNMFLLAGYRDPGKTLLDVSTKTNGITNVLRKVSKNTTDHMKKVWPEWEKQSVVLALNGEFIDAGISEEYNIYSLSRRSDGFKRFFTFLLMLSAQNATEDIVDNVIIIDEPDIALHPSGIQYLRHELEKIGFNNLVLVSSHSIFMIDKEIIDRHLIVEKKKEITDVRRVESSNITEEEVIFKALGYSLFDLLKAKNIIFEGWRDKKFFNLFLSSSIGKKKVNKDIAKRLGLLHAMGANDVARVANICENFSRDFIILTDSDKAAKDNKKKFGNQEKWLCYSDVSDIEAVTTEDFVANKIINKVVKEIIVENDISGSIILPETVTKGKVEFIQKKLIELNIVDQHLKQVMDKIKGRICDRVKLGDLDKGFSTVCIKLLSLLFP